MTARYEFSRLSCWMSVGIRTLTCLAYSEVTEFSGQIGDFKVKVHRKARYVDNYQMHCVWSLRGEVPHEGAQ